MRVSELYTSVQGEGPFVGSPTQFLRFGGCNMRCPGWPCDTLYAVEPKYHEDWEKTTAYNLFRKIPKWPKHICFTGGEPMIQKELELKELIVDLWQDGYSMEMFSNGSIEYPVWLQQLNVSIMLDWKLKGSGEADSYKDVRTENAIQLSRYDGIKFVVTNKEDLDEAVQVFDYLRSQGSHANIWVGAAFGKISEEEVVKYLLENRLPWKLNVQVHKYIWTPTERGV